MSEAHRWWLMVKVKWICVEGLRAVKDECRGLTEGLEKWKDRPRGCLAPAIIDKCKCIWRSLSYLPSQDNDRPSYAEGSRTWWLDGRGLVVTRADIMEGACWTWLAMGMVVWASKPSCGCFLVFDPQNIGRVWAGTIDGTWRRHEACVIAKQSCEGHMAIRSTKLELDHNTPEVRWFHSNYLEASWEYVIAL